MKYLLLIFVIFGFSYVGYGFSLYFKKRHSFFSALVVFLDKLSSDINFFHKKLSVIFSSEEFIDNPTLKKLANNFVVFLENKDLELSEEFLFKGINCLKVEERHLIYLFFLALGRHDIENELSLILSYKAKFQSFFLESESEFKKYSPLCKKLSFLLGLVFALVLA